MRHYKGFLSTTGIASMTVPVYIAEVSPPDLRGQLVTINCLFITGGQFIASVIDGAFSYLGHDGWRYLWSPPPPPPRSSLSQCSGDVSPLTPPGTCLVCPCSQRRCSLPDSSSSRKVPAGSSRRARAKRPVRFSATSEESGTSTRSLTPSEPAWTRRRNRQVPVGRITSHLMTHPRGFRETADDEPDERRTVEETADGNAVQR